MKIERLESLPQWEVREFYFTYLKLPYPEGEKNDYPAHHPDQTIETVMKLYHPLDDRPSGIVIFRDELFFEVVDTTTGERIRLTIGEMSTRDMKKQRLEALMQLALLDSTTISKGFAEITTRLERKQYSSAFQTFQGLHDRVKFLGNVLETVQKSTKSRGGPRSEERSMTDSSFTAVIAFDPETQRYKPTAHNLSLTQAAEISTEHSAAGTVKTIDQEKHHRGANASRCKPCQQAAFRITGDSTVQP